MSTGEHVEVRLVVATVPWRRDACQFLLDCAARQTRVPDAVELIVDGYGLAPLPQPPSILDRVTRRHVSPTLSGPGRRWKVIEEIAAENPRAVCVVFDDDMRIDAAPSAVADLVRPVVEDDAMTCASGITPDGIFVNWDDTWIVQQRATGKRPYDGPVAAPIANAMAVRAGRFAGFSQFAAELRALTSFDALGPGGDDEAAVAAHLWKVGCSMRRVGGLNLDLFHGSQDGGAEMRRRAEFAKLRNLPWDWQRRAVAKATGWPWPEDKWA